MKTIITGSTGMVGKGVLITCMEDPNVTSILIINRSSIGMSHPKLKEIIHSDFSDISAIKDQLTGYDACMYCMGISAAGLSEDQYHKVTYEMTLNFAKTLISLNPELSFCYVSGTGTDSSEKARVMWARVKGKTENALLSMKFKKAFMFRPGYIQPLHGIKSRTALYNFMYFFVKPLYPLMKMLMPKQLVTTDQVGQAMIHAINKGYEKNIITATDINILSEWYLNGKNS